MKLTRGTEVDFDSKRFFQLNLEAGHIEQAGAGRRIDEEVQVAVFLVFAVEDGTEHTRIRHAGLNDELTDGFAVLGQGFGRSHE